MLIKMSEESEPDVEKGWYIEHKEKLKKFSDEKPSWKEIKKIASYVKKGYILKVERGWSVR